MGWLISTDPTKDRKRLAEEILDDYRRPHDRPYPALVDHSLVGNTLYMVVHIPARRTNGGPTALARPERLADLEFDLLGNYRVILVYLLSGSRSADEGWGYKDMDESVGPSVTTCPERLLKQSQVNDRHGWREACREDRRKANERRRWINSLLPGQKVQMFRGYRYDEETRQQERIHRAAVFLRPYSKTYFVGRFEGESQQYRMRITDAEPAGSGKEAA